MYKLGLLFCLALLAVTPILSVTKCYQCSYFDFMSSSDENNKDCKDDVTKLEMVTCDDTITGNFTETTEEPLLPDTWQCVKVSGRVEIDDENYNLVQRFCRPGNITKAECKETKSFQTEFGTIKRGTHCVCEDKEEGCNVASSLTLQAVTLGAGLIAVLLSKV